MRRPLPVLLFALLAVNGCTSDGDPEPPVTTGVETQTESSRTDVALENVRYECGPTDATVVSFESAATTRTLGTAELVVQGETLGSLQLELGPAPTAHSFEPALTQVAYDAGAGEVRIVAQDGEVLASEPVQLRLEPGTGCG